MFNQTNYVIMLLYKYKFVGIIYRDRSISITFRHRSWV